MQKRAELRKNKTTQLLPVPATVTEAAVVNAIATVIATVAAIATAMWALALPLPATATETVIATAIAIAYLSKLHCTLNSIATKDIV